MKRSGSVNRSGSFAGSIKGALRPVVPAFEALRSAIFRRTGVGGELDFYQVTALLTS